MTAPTTTERALADVLYSHASLCIENRDAQRVAAAIDAHIRAVLAEERGRGEQAHAWSNVVTALDEVMPGWSEGFQAWGAIRQLAQDAKDATARAEKAEDALEQLQSAYDMTNELWGADRKRAELAEAELAKLRAQLDAMTGEQQPYAYDVKGWGMFRCKDEWTLAEEMRRATEMTYRTDLKPIPLYRHPAPTLTPMGACVVKDGVAVAGWSQSVLPQERCEKCAHSYVSKNGGIAYRCLVEPIIPNADGAQ